MRKRNTPANVDNAPKGVDKSRGNVEKPVRKPVAIREGRNGGKLNSGGVFPNMGRTPDAWKAEMRDLADRAAKAARAQQILETPDHPAWLGAWRFVAEHGYGKPTQRIEHAGDADQPLTVRVIFEGGEQ